MHVGAAEEGDTDADIGGLVVGEADDLGDLVAIAETQEADLVANGEVGGGEGDIMVVLQEHGLEKLHLDIGDDGERVAAMGVLRAGRISHEHPDEWEVDELTTLVLGDMHEDGHGDQDTLNGAALSPTPHMYLLT